MNRELNERPARPLQSKIFVKMKERWQLYVLLLPALLYIVLFAYKPMYGVLIAFQRYSLMGGVWGSRWIGFDNFIRLFSSYWFPIILKNTITIRRQLWMPVNTDCVNQC